MMKTIKLQTKMVLLIFGLLLFVLVVLGSLFSHMLSETLEDQIGKRALHVSETVASIPAVIAAFNDPRPWEAIQPIAEEVRIKTGAEFIVVGNKDGIRYSHPIPERIGNPMVGGDNHGALEEGRSYVSKAVGSLGPSLRGKVPIINDEGEVIGIVSVGFLIEDIEDTIGIYELRVVILIIVVLAIGIIGALQIGVGFKKAIFGLEPSEIGSLFQERSAILESIREGIIAINGQGKITMVNKAAYQILGIEPQNSVLGEQIINVLPHTKMLEVLKTGQSQFDHEIEVGKNEVIVSRVPIIYDGNVKGVVSSFRNKTEIDQLTKELSQVQGYAEALRAQTHEYSNKLYMISGLVQLGSNQEAIELIHKETSDYQELVQFLMSNVPDTLIAAILLGKYNRALELKVEFMINQESSMREIPPVINREKLVTVLGNLLDNAFESVLEANQDKRVHLFMTDLGHDLIFEIEDSGVGLSDDMAKLIFKKGYSTKNGDDRGIGLHLVDKSVKYLGGYVTVTKSESGGAVFTVVIPKEGGKSHE
jgi:two-component system CitB family sensor kinase